MNFSLSYLDVLFSASKIKFISMFTILRLDFSNDFTTLVAYSIIDSEC